MDNVNLASAIDPEDFKKVQEDFENDKDNDFSSLFFSDEDEDFDDENTEDAEEVTEEEQNTSEESAEEVDSEQVDESETEVNEPSKQTQSAEENAKFAEQRRQQQLQEKLKAELENSTEYQIVKMLSKQHGVTPEEMYKQLQDQEIEERAKQQGVPVEYLRKTQEQDQRVKELEEKLVQLEYDRWYNEKLSESKAVVEKYNGIITEEDTKEALSYMLNDLGTTNLSLDKVVRLLHGDKLEAELKRIAKQEALAEVSGRKAAPPAPQGRKTTSSTFQLTAEEKEIARKLNMSEEEYFKNKS